jgi:hypothetical protein
MIQAGHASPYRKGSEGYASFLEKKIHTIIDLDMIYYY